MLHKTEVVFKSSDTVPEEQGLISTQTPARFGVIRLLLPPSTISTGMAWLFKQKLIDLKMRHIPLALQLLPWRLIFNNVKLLQLQTFA